jgi:hypothetical protein
MFQQAHLELGHDLLVRFQVRHVMTVVELNRR